MKRILIAGANPYNANKGVAALAVSSIRIIHEIVSAKGGDFEICVYNHEFRKTYDTIEMIDGSIKFQNIYPSDLFSITKIIKTLSSRWRLYNLREFLKVDYVFNISAGDGFSDIYGEESFISLTKINKLCRLFRKPYYLMPQTYGPFYNDHVIKRAKKDCMHAAGLMSRDLESTHYVKEQLGVKHVIDAIDVAFCLPYIPTRQDDRYIHIGINISQTLCYVEKKHKFHVSFDYYSVMKELIFRLLVDGYKVHLIPHVVNSANNNSNEYFISYSLWKELRHPNLWLAPFFLSPIEAKSYISSMDLLIGSRMHACIAAFSANVPVLLLGYSRKFSGLFSDTLQFNYIADVSDSFSLDNVMKMVCNMLSKLSELKEIIERRNQTIVKAKTDLIYNTISDFIK